MQPGDHAPHDNRLSLGADNPVTLRLTNRSPRPVTFWLRDEPPEAFIVLAVEDKDGSKAARNGKKQVTATMDYSAAVNYSVVAAPS